MKSAILAFGMGLSLLLSGCIGPTPIHQSGGVAIPEALQMVNPRDLTASVLNDEAIRDRGWTVEEVRDDRVRLNLQVRLHQAVVDVFFNDDRLRPVLVRSTNLDQADGEIHRNFNRWMRYLESDIEAALEERAARWTGRG